MTNATAVEICSKSTNKMGNYQKTRTYTNRSVTYFKNANSPTKNIREQNQNIVCDKSKLRPKSTESFVIQIMPNPTRHGSPKLKQSPRASPSKEGSRSSPTIGGHYAGAKFSEPPAPTSLPKPPLHWTSLMSAPLHVTERADKGYDVSHQLKMLLNVQA